MESRGNLTVRKSGNHDALLDNTIRAYLQQL